MKITCNREKLALAFGIAGTVANAKAAKEILQNVKLEAQPGKTTLMATDMETGIRIDVEGADVEQPGSVLLPVGRFGLILRENSDEFLTIETEGTETLVRSSFSKFNLPSANPDEYPSVAQFEEDKYHEVPARLFCAMVKRTTFATDPDSTRYALGGVLFEMDGEQVLAVGTDGRRLARMQGTAVAVGNHKTEGANTIVPPRSLSLMERSIVEKDEVVHVAARRNDVMLRTGRCTVYSRLVEGRYPNWRQVIPTRQDSEKLDLVAGPFLNAIRQAAIVADTETHGLNFDFTPGNLVLSAKTANLGTSRIEHPISYSGRSIAMKLDFRYVQEFLRTLEPDTAVTVDMASSTESTLFTTEDGYAYVVMPMALER